MRSIINRFRNENRKPPRNRSRGLNISPLNPARNTTARNRKSNMTPNVLSGNFQLMNNMPLEELSFYK